MGVLAWLIFPVVAVVLAIFWVNWSARPRGPVEAHESLAERERFVQAMARPLEPTPPRTAAERAPHQVDESYRRAS